jgi:hypothetical protein
LHTEVMDTGGAGDEMKARHEEMAPRVREADDTGPVEVFIPRSTLVLSHGGCRLGKEDRGSCHGRWWSHEGRGY